MVNWVIVSVPSRDQIQLAINRPLAALAHYNKTVGNVRSTMDSRASDDPVLDTFATSTDLDVSPGFAPLSPVHAYMEGPMLPQSLPAQPTTSPTPAPQNREVFAPSNLGG